MKYLRNVTIKPSFFPGDPLYVGFDLTIASFDSISEVSMVSISYSDIYIIGDTDNSDNYSFFRITLSQCI